MHDRLGNLNTGGKVILRFDGKRVSDGAFDDVADEYAIVVSETAMCGVLVFARYGEKWTVNPWNERPVVRELIDRLGLLNPVATPDI